MKRFLLALAIATRVFAADSDGFVPMFNGRDLTGWVNANCAPETWSVTNGLIHCTGHPTGAMRTERQYENFIMEVEWRHLSSGGNSGIFLWGTPIAAPAVPFLRGIEVQVLDHGYNAKGKNEWYTTHGDVFPIHGARMKPFGRANGERSFPSEERSKPSPEWNHYRIVATNGVIRLSVNGKEVSGGEECNYRKGYLALESEGGPVQFRNLRIKELPSSNVTPELTAPVDEGFRTIFNGLDLREWKTLGSGWTVDGERLRAKASVSIPLQTEKQFGNAAFIFDIRIPKESAPGKLPLVMVRGVTYAVSGLTPGNYTRVLVKNEGDKVTIQTGFAKANAGASESAASSVTIDHQEGGVVPARGSFGFASGGVDVELMNIYAREL